MAHGTPDYYLPRDDLVLMLSKLDDIDGTMDGVITLDELNSAQCEMLAKLTGIDTSVVTGGDLINKLDALDGTMDGRLTLAEVQGVTQYPMRPKYGAAKSAFDDIAVAGNAETELCSVSGKGMIYGGALRVDPDFTQALCRPYLYIDDERIASTPFSFMNSYHYVIEHCHAIYLLKYDDITFSYVVGFSHGFTFESGFRVAYKEFYNETPTVSFRVVYALIE